MRWIDFNDKPEETAECEAIVAKLDAWWREFEGKVDKVSHTATRTTRRGGGPT